MSRVGAKRQLQRPQIRRKWGVLYIPCALALTGLLLWLILLLVFVVVKVVVVVVCEGNITLLSTNPPWVSVPFITTACGSNLTPSWCGCGCRGLWWWDITDSSSWWDSMLLVVVWLSGECMSTDIPPVMLLVLLIVGGRGRFPSSIFFYLTLPRYSMCFCC